MYFLLMRTTGLVREGKGRRQHMSKLHDNVHAKRAGYVLLELYLYIWIPVIVLSNNIAIISYNITTMAQYA